VIEEATKSNKQRDESPKGKQEMTHLQSFLKLQPIGLQWTMHNKPKSIFGF
jgi:hypothetical protein